MRYYTDVLRFLLFPLLMSLWGCLEIQVHTTVAPDGSCERTISMKSPTKSLPPGAFPAGTDSTWSIRWKEPNRKDTAYEYEASKKFRTPDELHQEYATRHDTGIIGLTVSLERRFEWFYTYLDYREVYTEHRSDSAIPVTEYLSPEEIERYVRGEKNDALQSKVDKWNDRNEFEEFYAPIVAEVERRNDPAIPVSLLLAKKMELFNRFFEADSLSKHNGKKVADSTKNESPTVEDVLRLSAKILGTDAVYSLQSVAEQSLSRMDERETERKHPNGWTCSLQLPGLLINTNSNSVEGNTLTWKFGANQVHVGDYVMLASSRVANVWAFVVTGIAALFVMLITLRKALRIKRANPVHGK